MSSPTLAEAVKSALTEQVILISQLSPDYLISEVMGGKEEVSVAQIETVLTGSPGQPVLTNPQKAILQAVKEGVAQGKFAVTVGGETIREENILEAILTDPDAKIVQIPIEQQEERPPEPVPLCLLVEITSKNLYPLRKILDSLQGTDAQITVKIKDAAGNLSKKRDELEEILKDYGVTHTWSEGELRED